MKDNNKTSLPSSLKDKIWQAYVNSPINFSLLTGCRYPGIPRLKGVPIFGRIFSFLKQNGPLNNFIKAGQLAAQHPSGISYFWLGFKLVFFITKPEHIKQLVIEQKENVSSQEPLKFMKVFFGSSIFVDPDEVFEKKKTIYAKWLTRKAIVTNYETSIKVALNTCLDHIARNNQKELNLESLTRKFPLQVVLNSTMQFLTVDEKVLQDINDYLEYINENIFTIKNLFRWNFSNFLRKTIEPKSRHEDIKQDLQNKFQKLIIENREEDIKNTESFLRDIWELSDIQLISLKNSFNDIFGDANAALVAGVETTSSTLQFVIKLLAANPQIQTRLRKEIQEKLEDIHKDELSINEIIQLHYLDCVVKETLRLYPSSTAVLRTVKNKIKIADIPLKPGDLVIFSTFVTHRLQSIWGNDIETFNPDRFFNEDKNLNDAFVPFSKGPHACIGRDLALLEIKALITEILLNYNIEIDKNDFQYSFEKGALKPKLPTLVRFRRVSSRPNSIYISE